MDEQILETLIRLKHLDHIFGKLRMPSFFPRCTQIRITVTVRERGRVNGRGVLRRGGGFAGSHAATPVGGGVVQAAEACLAVEEKYAKQ